LALPSTRWRAASSIGFAGADQQHRRILQAREGFLRQRTAAEATETGVRADARVGARALGGGEGMLEQPVEVLAERARAAGDGPGFLHLAEDLRFAEHQRIQAGRDAEQVADRVRVVVAVQVGVQVAGVGMAGEPSASASPSSSASAYSSVRLQVESSATSRTAASRAAPRARAASRRRRTRRVRAGRPVRSGG
jgi:hypothetical protein